ncbi:hypothetical protein [Caproiciproducens sp. CPB-2]|uniref:hypothetical protein n=1 Tax=Caproiciproducens sp. CPB-2 TaxID=3030017 RepID=UPI0023D9F4B5|nr:hypothetical protein [Caproiciproducens sp. CPB-2]MDF1495605.1 hypothetical protein [Caproiciproducens sp. CPB-2]
MYNDNKELQDAKKANQKAKQGSTSSYSNSIDPNLEEARQLNSQSANSGSGSGNSGTSGTEEAKQLNQKSRQNKK